MSGFTPDQLPPRWPSPPRAPDPPSAPKASEDEPPTASGQYPNMPDEDPERIAEWGLGRHNGWFAWRTGENIPPNNSMGKFGTLPGPEQHPLAVPAIWIAAAGILPGLPLAWGYSNWGYGNAASSVVIACVVTALGALALVFAIIALAKARRQALPVVAGILGLVVMVTGSITGVYTWRQTRVLTQTIQLYASAPAGSWMVAYTYQSYINRSYIIGMANLQSDPVPFTGSWSKAITLSASRGNPLYLTLYVFPADNSQADSGEVCSIAADTDLIAGPPTRDPNSVYPGVECNALWPG